MIAHGNEEGVGVAVDVPLPEEDGDVDGVFVAVTLMEAVDDSDVDVVGEEEAPNECVAVTDCVMLGVERGSTSLHVGGAVPENPEMDVEKITTPAASSSSTVSPTSRSVQQSWRPHTSICAIAHGEGSVTCTQGLTSLPETHMSS